ncbi:plant viral-response family protein [Thalictrum thalictroides]|uniref:Plant viral-response family protein n=1 Tax=Thalictrum thalictroides TaxID=46969 RepID=A0A7J6WKF0_THATH|nr:plant viral-response family protein [Thalictrum thalictroides]
MAAVISHIFSSSALTSLGLYHLICTTRNHLKSPRDYIAKPYHLFPFPHSSSSTSRLRFLQLYLLILCLVVAFAHQTINSFDSDPLLKGSTPVHRFTSYQSAAVLFLFLILSLSLLLSETTSLLPFPSDLFFAVASAIFFLQFSVSSSSASVQTSDLQAKCDSVSARVSALSSLLCLLLACQPKLFVADVGLGASLCLQGLWVLQTGLSLYVEAFIPEGCHRLLDVVKGVEGSTKCDLEDSRLRAVAILDLVFVIHVMFVVIIVMVTYAMVAKSVGIRRVGSYEALSTGEVNHFQLKALEGTQA